MKFITIYVALNLFKKPKAAIMIKNNEEAFHITVRHLMLKCMGRVLHLFPHMGPTDTG